MNNKEFIGKSLTTIFEMLEDRGYEFYNINKDGYHETLYQNNNTSVDIEVDIDTNKKIKIMYFLAPKFAWNQLKSQFENDSEEKNKSYKLIILVLKDKISQNNIKAIHELGYNVEIFDIKELQFNISKHILVPKHTLIKDEKRIKDLIEKYSIKTKYQFPHILKNDPMSRYLGLRSGDVVEISRKSPTAGEYISYRCCL